MRAQALGIAHAEMCVNIMCVGVDRQVHTHAAVCVAVHCGRARGKVKGMNEHIAASRAWMWCCVASVKSVAYVGVEQKLCQGAPGCN